MREYIEQFIHDTGEEFQVEEWTSMIYDDEINFNNADPTSGQRCWDWSDIKSCVEEILGDDAQ